MKPKQRTHRNCPPARERVATQRQPRASIVARLPGAGRKAADRAGPNRVQASPPGKKSHMSNSTRPRGRRKEIQIIVFAVIDSARPIGVYEPLILSVLRDVSIQCSESQLRRELCYLEEAGVIRLDRVDDAPWRASLAGRATGIAEGDTVSTFWLTFADKFGAMRRPAGKVARADSRRSKRVSR